MFTTFMEQTEPTQCWFFKNTQVHIQMLCNFSKFKADTAILNQLS